MSDKLVERGLELAERHWVSPIGGGVLVALATIPALLARWIAVGAQGLSGWDALVIGGIGLLSLLGWLYSNRVPKTPKGKIGIVVAIACESDRHERRIRSDLIERLREEFRRDEETHQFHLMVFSRLRAELMRDQAAVDRYRRKTHATFMLIGEVRERPVAGGTTAHHVAFRGGVWHAPVPEEAKAHLAAEMRGVLPGPVVVKDEDTVFEFRAASEWLGLSARYVVGLTALIAGHVKYAEALLLGVEAELPSAGGKFAPLRQVAQRIPRHLISLYRAWLRYLVEGFIRDRDPSLLVKAEEIADKLLRREPNDYPGLVAKSIASFRLRRDVQGARQLLRKASKQNPKDATWRLNLAFLLAYTDDLRGASAEYARAFKAELQDETVLVQSEEFIQEIVEAEPDRFTVHYAAGLINYFGKRDLKAARQDFSQFLGDARAVQYPMQRGEAQRLLADIGQLSDDEGEEASEVDLQLRPVANGQSEVLVTTTAAAVAGKMTR